jgi:hypothetical protein
MSPILRSALAVVIVLGIAGCNKPQPRDLLKTQRDALEKAKGVQNTLDQSAASTRAKIDEAEAGR